jgi:hypothetical protein
MVSCPMRKLILLIETTVIRTIIYRLEGIRRVCRALIIILAKRVSRRADSVFGNTNFSDELKRRQEREKLQC